MGVELRERKWYGVLGIEKVGVEGYWKKKPLHIVLLVGVTSMWKGNGYRLIDIFITCSFMFI